MDVKKRIEEVITEKGLSKKGVAERMGKVKQAFNSLMTDPKWSTIEQVADAIGISVEELLFGKVVTNTEVACPYCGGRLDVAVTVRGKSEGRDVAAMPQQTGPAGF